MHGRRILYGLAGVPKSLPPDDKRLPGVVLDPAPLRLNSETLPPAAMPADLADHAARLAAIRAWLHAACGDYGGRQRAFIDAYLAFVAAQLQAERQALTSALSRFDDLYAVEDWTWSALRPLPRAWAPAPDGSYVPVGLAFWTGTTLLATECADDALPCVVRISPDAAFPAALDRFWEGQALPATPFGRPLPAALPA